MSKPSPRSFARLTPAALLSRLALSGLCATFTLAVAGADLAGAQTTTAGRRPTVPVVPVARVTGGETPRAAARPKAGAKPAAKPASRTAAKPAAAPKRSAPKPTVVAPVALAPVALAAADTGLAEDAAPVSSELAGEVAAPSVPAARSTGYARYRSARDSIAGEVARAGAEMAKGLRVAVSLETRELAVLDGADTLLVAPVAIGMDTTLRYGSRTWTFDTPRGKRTVLRKNENPIWVPPDWHYAEVANKKGLKLANLPANKAGVAIGGGRRLVVRNGMAGILTGSRFEALPTDEEIVVGSTLYIPPLGSKNRQIEGELGRFRLDMGNGYMLHGTPHEDTIGDAATHGCIRLYDEDIEWLYQHVPLGTPVYIF